MMPSSKLVLALLLIVQSKVTTAADYYDDNAAYHDGDSYDFETTLRTETNEGEYEENYGENRLGNFYLAETGGIEDEWIVVMKEDATRAAFFSASNLENFAYDVAEKTGSNIEVMSTFTSALQGFAVRGMTEDAAREYTKNKHVDFVEQNFEVSAYGSTAKTWGLDRIDERNMPLDKCFAPMGNKDGSGVTAYIIDTGIRVTHNEFKTSSGSRASWGINTVGDGKDYDCNGHGTHVAGTVGGKNYGVAKNVNLVAVKVLGCNGRSTGSSVITGINWVKSNASGKKATANLSLGGGASTALDQAVRNLHNSGVPTVVAAGNDNSNACSKSPAREPAVITVGSTGPGSCSSCISGNAGILTKTGNVKSITQVRDLKVGDIVQGLDFKRRPTTCKIEAIGSFGTGVVYGNYTSDHFVFNPKSGKVEEHGDVGPKDIIDKYDLIADCPLVEDESGMKFGPMDSDFCGGSIKELSWKEYLLLHKAILRVVRKSGAFWFQLSSYKNMETVRDFAPSVCKSMLKCMKDQKMCNSLEKASQQFIDNALTESSKVKTLETFTNIGSFNEVGSISAVVTGGATIGAALIADSVEEYNEEEYMETSGAKEDKRSCFSNYGSCLDIWAPGANIKSAVHNSDSKYGEKSGTSMAAPHVCGAIALHLQNGSSASAAEAAIKSQATKNKVEDRKSGSPNSLLYIGGGTACPTPSPSCIAGDTGILSQPTSSDKESVIQVRNLQIGDTVRGFDSKMKPTSCTVEAIGGFGTGEVYGNYTADHFVYNKKSGKVEEHGKHGTMVVTDKYDLIADCPLVEDESGMRFGPMDSDFCGGRIKKLSWRNYLTLHTGILRVVRQSGTFWFQASSYKDMSLVQKFAPRICKNMLRCMKNHTMCSKLEKSSNQFVNKVLTDSAKGAALKTFTNIGSRCEMGSVSAIVTAGSSVDDSLIGTTSC